MKNRTSLITTTLMGAGLLAAVISLSIEQKALAAPPPADPAHAAHVAAGKAAAAAPGPTAPAALPHVATVPAGPAAPPAAVHAAKGDPVLSQQLSQLQAKVVHLEATLAKGAPPKAAAPAGAAMPGMPAASPTMSKGMSKGMGKMKPGAAMPAMSAGAAPAPPMAGMGMMAMMDKMMGMMDKMMPMGGVAMPPAAPMPAGGAMPMMDDDMMEMPPMGGGAAMPAAPAAPMSGGMPMMDDDKMEMAGMMGMAAMSGAAPGAMPQSALPGFPGASHLYHIGSTGFFLDHPQHIALTTEQQGALNSAKERALLAKSTADRAVEQAEQELWTLTAADQPDAAVIATKLTEIGKLRADERLAFIRTVGEASKLLTDPQRQSLTGFAPPAPAAPAAAAAPMAPMTDM